MEEGLFSTATLFGNCVRKTKDQTLICLDEKEEEITMNRQSFPEHDADTQWVPFDMVMYDLKYLADLPSIATYNGGGAFLDGKIVWELCEK